MEVFSRNHEKEVVIHIENLKKRYQLGEIGSGTLQGDLQSLWAKVCGKEDPNSRIGKQTYGSQKEFWALKGIELDIYQGETLGIIGGNGAGKSTLLKILSRVTAPTEGKICVNGRIASMLEVGTGFHRELTGRENVYLNGAIMGMTEKEVEERMEEIVSFAEMEQFIDTPVKRYSSGMYVRLAFSVAAHLNADILIMDEVLAVGDARFQKKCIDKMQQLASEEGKTVLFVSHNMNTISSMCSRCVVLEQGQVHYVGETDKAIEYYNQKHYGEKAVRFSLEGKERPQNYNPLMYIKSFEMVGKDTPDFTYEEKLHGIIKWVGKEESSDICLRCTLHYNGMPIGTYISQTIKETVQKGACYETEFVCDIDMLAVGTYTASLGLYRCTKEGVHSPLDYIEDAFCFEVIKGKYKNRTWNHRWWGSNIYEEAVIVKHEQIGGE